MTTPTSELTALVATRVAEFGNDGLRADVVAMIKRFVLDTVGTTLAAGTLGAGVGQVLQLVRETGGSAQSSVLGTGERTSTPLAALANAAMAHALNFDDASEIHLGVTTIPAALAIAERRTSAGGQRTSGRQFMGAVGAGMELMARLGRCLSAVPFPDEGHPQPTQMPGYFAAAASSGRLLGLAGPALHSAFGIALMQAAGARQNLLDGRPAKAIYAGFAAQGGVQAALLASHGLDGGCQAFEGDSGLFATYYRGGVDTASLAEPWDEPCLLDSTFKQWPTTAAGHPQLRAALRLRAQCADRLDDIVAISLIGNPRVLTFARPAERKQAPSCAVDAEDSVFFPVAKALLHGGVSLADIHGSGLHDPQAVALARRMSFEVDERHGRDDGAVEILFADGRSLRAEHDAESTPDMTYDQSVVKFVDCVAHAPRPLSEEGALVVVDLIARLEELNDIGVLVDALSPEGLAA